MDSNGAPGTLKIKNIFIYCSFYFLRLAHIDVNQQEERKRPLTTRIESTIYDRAAAFVEKFAI
ncbi:hypothetical protein [Dyadobacter sp.]|uniref:hypothetical protein n=1 Tax=Dyadobacter sp. TaxID=1914288 RepID=UPI003F72A7F1